MRWLSLGLVICLLFAPVAALAEGENDPLWSNPTYEKKVFDIGQRILQANGIQERISFRVIRDRNVVNAYAMRDPKDAVVVEKGLLNFVSSDDEMAAVLGHEITHIIRRHQRKVVVKRLAVLAGLATIIAVASPTAQDASDNTDIFVKRAEKRRAAGGAGFNLGPFEQKYETEADLMGIDLMVKAGYNPLAAEKVMTKITSDRSWAAFWEAHPPGTRRLRDMQHHIAAHYPQFLSPQLAKDWGQPKPQLPGTQYFNPPQPADSSTDENARLLKELSTTGSSEKPASIDTPSSGPENVQLLKELTGSSALAAVSPNPPPPKETPKKQNPPASPENLQHASLPKTLLALGPQHLAVLKLLSERGYLSEDRIGDTALKELPEEHRESILAELNRKNLIRVVGTEPDRIYMLADWVAKEMDQSKP